MTRTMALRGPDDEGLWTDTHVALGHRRLAVIDIEGGVQPMSEGPATIVYNGETYNFHELRGELEGHGHRFRTRTDNEHDPRADLPKEAGHVDPLNAMV